jgi:hypothetical protein
MTRVFFVATVWAAAIAVAVLALKIGIGWLALAVVLAALAGLGTWDLLQTRHSILRAYPILGHARFIAELIRPGDLPVLHRIQHRRCAVQPGEPRRGLPARQGHQGR